MAFLFGKKKKEKDRRKAPKQYSGYKPQRAWSGGWRSVGKRKVKRAVKTPAALFKAYGLKEIKVPADYHIEIDPQTLAYLLATQMEDYHVEIGGGFEVTKIDGVDTITYALKSNRGTAGYVRIDTEVLVPAFIIGGHTLNGAFHTHVMETFWSSTDLIGDGSGLRPAEEEVEVPVNEDGLTATEYYAQKNKVRTVPKTTPAHNTYPYATKGVSAPTPATPSYVRQDAPGQLQLILDQWEFVKEGGQHEDFFFLVYSVQPLSFKVRKYMLTPKDITYFDTYVSIKWDNNIDLALFGGDPTEKEDVGNHHTKLSRASYVNYGAYSGVEDYSYGGYYGYAAEYNRKAKAQTSTPAVDEDFHTWRSDYYYREDDKDSTFEESLYERLRELDEEDESTAIEPYECVGVDICLKDFLARPSWGSLEDLLNECLLEKTTSTLTNRILDYMPQWYFATVDYVDDTLNAVLDELVADINKQVDPVNLIERYSLFIVMICLTERFDQLDDVLRGELESVVNTYKISLKEA